MDDSWAGRISAGHDPTRTVRGGQWGAIIQYSSHALSACVVHTTAIAFCIFISEFLLISRLYLSSVLVCWANSVPARHHPLHGTVLSHHSRNVCIDSVGGERVTPAMGARQRAQARTGKVTAGENNSPWSGKKQKSTGKGIKDADPLPSSYLTRAI